MALSKKRMDTNHKWDKENYDRIMVRLPKGGKAIIDSAGETYNSFMNKAFKEYCEAHKIDFFKE